MTMHACVKNEYQYGYMDIFSFSIYYGTPNVPGSQPYINGTSMVLKSVTALIKIMSNVTILLVGIIMLLPAHTGSVSVNLYMTAYLLTYYNVL